MAHVLHTRQVRIGKERDTPGAGADQQSARLAQGSAPPRDDLHSVASRCGRGRFAAWHELALLAQGLDGTLEADQRGLVFARMAGVVPVARQREALAVVRRATPLRSLDSRGSNFGSDSISMMGSSDSRDEADTERIRIGASLHLALGGLQIVDLASVRQYLASIGH